MFKRIFRLELRSGLGEILVSLAISACSSSGVTKKQREALEHYVDETADAIVFSATKVKNLLSAYRAKNGGWPKDDKAQREIFSSLDPVLEEHHISKQKLLEVDDNEVIVEYMLSTRKFKQFPRMLESWVIIFSSGNHEELKIVSIFPNWLNIREKQHEFAYPPAQVEKWQDRFQNLLREKLDSYSITLSEQINETS